MSNEVFCGKPLVKCQNNNNCYDPNVQYKQDPCRVEQVPDHTPTYVPSDAELLAQKAAKEAELLAQQAKDLADQAAQKVSPVVKQMSVLTIALVVVGVYLLLD
jgi:hypothetical protein